MAMLAPMPSCAGAQFEEFDSTMPLKVNIASLETKPYTGSIGANMQESRAPFQLTASQWTTAVNAMSPFLSTKGLQRALTLLNMAMANLQRMQALDEMPVQTAGSIQVGGQSNLQCAAVCAMMQVQIQDQQRLLYEELQQLPYREGVLKSNGQILPTAGAPAPMRLDIAAMTPGAPPVGKAAAPLSVTQAAAPENNSFPPGRRRAPQTLSTSLRILEAEDPDSLLIVRRISKLGFKATQLLKKHFSAYGSVVKVLLAHSTARQYCDQQFHVKRRPSNLGFIQMGTAEAAKLVLAAGTKQEIEGITICVQKFERHEDCGEAEDEQNDEVEETFAGKDLRDATISKNQRPRGMSDLSTCASENSPKGIVN